MSGPLALALISLQLPDIKHLPLKRVGKSGTDNVLFRIGPALVARFPRLPHAAAQNALQSRWLPILQPGLPLAVPLTSHVGGPALGYPFAWSVGPWLPGNDAFAAPPTQARAATDLGHFLKSLHSQPAPADAPRRGLSDRLDLRLGAAEHFIAQFGPEADPHLLRHELAHARALPAWNGDPVWVHGDLHALNLLTRRGRLSAVIDWGAMGLGDPATDLMAGWTLFDAPARALFRATMAPSPQAWARGRARAFAMAIMAIPYYRTSNLLFHATMVQTLARVLGDLD